MSEPRNKMLFAAFIIVLICLCLVSLQRQVEIQQDLLFETFSAIIQIFVALITLLGMVGVFRLELLNNKIDKLAESAGGLIVHFRGLPAQNLLPEEILAEGENIIEEGHPASAGEVRRLEIVVTKLKTLSNAADNIRIYILNFAIFASVAIGISLIFLVITPVISSLYLGLPALFVVIVLSIVSLLSVIGLIQSIL